MRIFVLLAALAAGAVCAGAPRTVGLGGDAPACLVLPSLAAVGLDVDGVPAAAQTGTIDCDVRETAGVSGVLAVRSNALPAFASAAGAAAYVVDPFLCLFVVWSDGPLGELQRTANRLRAAGDEAAFAQATNEYWRALGLATERRETFRGRGGQRLSTGSQ